jgi:hypothetical protein
MYYSNRQRCWAQARNKLFPAILARNVGPPSRNIHFAPSHSDSLRFLGRQLLLSCQHALDAIDPLPLIDGELLVTCDNGAGEQIKPSQCFLFLTHRANDEFVSAAGQYLEGSGPETADFVAQANRTRRAIFRQLGGA